MPPKANPTAANAPVACSAPDCDYTVPAEADLAIALQFLTLHIQTAHPKPPGPNPTDRPITKVELRSRPEVTMDTSEADWRFFLSEWKDYKRVTGITGQAILDELWSCMKGDLKRLAFDQGGKDNLTTEPLMIARIYSLAVMELHTAVHTIHLHEAKQTKEESTKAFAARFQGIASSCQLTKLCTCREPVTVSFMEETVYHVVLAGLRDSEMQERCLAAAYLKSVTNLQQLLQFCSAEESSKTSNGSSLIGALKSSYQREKRAGHMLAMGNQVNPGGKLRLTAQPQRSSVGNAERLATSQSFAYQALWLLWAEKYDPSAVAIEWLCCNLPVLQSDLFQRMEKV